MDKQKVFNAAKEVHGLIALKIGTEQGMNAETMVSAAARLAGTWLYRSFDYSTKHIEPGTVMLSDQANEEWPKLMSLLGAALAANGIRIDSAKVVEKTPEEHRPKKGILEIQSELQESYNRIVLKHGLNHVQGAHVGTIACGTIIAENRDVLDPHIAFGIAIYGFIEGAKTAPIPLVSKRLGN